MQHDEIRAVFRRVYNGKVNFMTPTVMDYGKRGKMVWELSRGDNILGDGQLYGVTVIELPNTKRHDLSQCFNTHKSAHAYIKGDFQ
jgi:hypothetical protein